MLKKLRADLEKFKNPEKAKSLQRFFKTGKGQYGEGDIFLGISVPILRKIAIKYKDLPFTGITKLLKSKIHEERLIALLLLVHNFQKGDKKKRKEIYEFYLKSTKHINNWDLVDLSAPKILGADLLDPRLREDDKKILYKLAKSENLWERRIAIIATYQFIWKAKEYKNTFKIAEILLSDKHDLIQKAVGWMLREVGKRISQDTEEDFLRKNYHKMGRTALRYAIERFPESLRIKYLKGEI
ncbi:DNA alkylation repair protein [Candidatus Daviesbacteria bacterium RIFCSPHIGHO2_12_FULL_37_11]|uniref:DNA alkylation repair protein n=1 Tax=Candidatus Daviesbacteria bacterium RIFCSPHIGHO2_12_FULL_37_11 TaxID=1797777 RepID=A0A1F5K9V8_9BACT|nr:MAG: DNA alkylation repair protein [Candidatus Daviesbacteria bacterium GWA1_38_6]OGE16174.1 MAG: DNA alkylation repair protein [Candidatus Daviesbacteria bacterium RIFCSPHIGHO2_01_FULL_37_27]OGE37696.1 MAG: DNA alkylation repair protein [Candidatus Daviesbacteria bacterium RIFCSPHIGHO2_12_FULL_37_11]OGE46345.1 MAG: DNA alkylation repair protein [Candidatus Daviesbacteria bacterium RIFCSPLOWO2_01_FULL_37_10]